MNIAFISLGCSKNRVDSEIMMAILQKYGYHIVSEEKKADMIVINTCGFITSAKQEGIQQILEIAELKAAGKIKYILITGCMAQRYGDELMEEIAELDAVIGIGMFPCIADAVDAVLEGERVKMHSPPPEKYIEEGPRILTTPAGSCYIKIAEGCNNRCSYCSIPLIRGDLRSRPSGHIVQEIKDMVGKGIREVILISQDTSSYGKDFPAGKDLGGLLREINEIPGKPWIRLMYLHPARINDDLISAIREAGTVLPYLDVPIQHASDRVLHKMRRGYTRQYLQELFFRLKNDIPGLVLRTTVMAGFPGESEEDFLELCQFLQEIEFDWLGSFAYEAEEGTAAFELGGQVFEEIKTARREQLQSLQKEITRKKNVKRIGQEEDILVSTRLAKGLYIGRAYFQAPEVDGITLVKSEEKIAPGDLVRVIFRGIREYDMIGDKIS